MIEIRQERTLDAQVWKETLEKLGLFEKLQNAKTVVLKPNFAAGTKVSPERHVCTNLEFIGNVAALCREVNPTARIFVAEGDSTGDGFAYLKFEHFGLPASVDPNGANGVETLDLSRDKLQHVEDKRLLYFNQTENLWLSEQLLNADFVVSLSNLKTHTVTLYTGACKNLFGTLPASNKSVYHPHIHQVVHDVTLAIKPDLNVVDAFYGMEKNGPVGGNDVDGGFRIFSDSALEADCYGAAAIGIKPNQVPYLKMLAKDLGMPKIDQELVKKYRFKAAYPTKFVRFSNAIGLWVQRQGGAIAHAGHRVHIARNPVLFAYALFRPLIVKVVGLKKIKSMKGKK